MDDAQAVRMVQRTGHLARNAHGIRDRQLALRVEPLAQGLALHHRHHVEQRALGVARVEQRQDMWMTEFRGEMDLAQEPVATDAGGDVVAQDLDRDGAIVLPSAPGM